MKIALFGYGKMGKMIEAEAIGRGHTISAKITSTNKEEPAIQDADLCMDFSHPHALLNHMRLIARHKKNCVIGTTGWENERAEIEELIAKSQIGVVASANFSIGIALFLKLLQNAAKIISPYEEYDIAGIEAHHHQKADSPSGTAKEIIRVMRQAASDVKEIPFSSIRCGAIPGTHTLMFDSAADTITLSHVARNRDGFAKGALIAAEWLQGKNGLYSFNDCL